MYKKKVRVVALALAIVMLMSVSAFAGTDISSNYASSATIYETVKTVIAKTENPQSEITKALDRASTFLATDRRALMSADGFAVPEELPEALSANRTALAALIAADGISFNDHLKTLTVRIPQNFSMDYGTVNVARSTLQAALNAGFTDFVFQNDFFAVRMSLVDYLPQVPQTVSVIKVFAGETRNEVPQVVLDKARSLPILVFKEYRDGTLVSQNYSKNAVALLINSAMYAAPDHSPIENLFYRYDLDSNTVVPVLDYRYSNLTQTASFGVANGNYFLMLPNETPKEDPKPTPTPKPTPNPGPGGNSSQTTEPGDGQTYADVAVEHWAFDSIEKLSHRGIISGVGGGMFEPESFVTREQFAKLLAEGFGLDENVTLPFTDVPENDWAVPYIARVYGNNIIRGIGNNLFGYGQQITRQDMAVMLYKAMLLKDAITAEENQNAFADDQAIADYAREAVYAMRAKGIINGMSDGTFAPNAPATRAQAAKMLCAAMGI